MARWGAAARDACAPWSLWSAVREAPAKRSPRSLQLEKSPHGNEDPAQSNFNKIIKIKKQGFPDGSVVKDAPTNAGCTPGLGRSQMPRSNWARVPQPLSLCSRAREPQPRSLCSRAQEQLLGPLLQLLKPEHARACAPQEKPAQRESKHHS